MKKLVASLTALAVLATQAAPMALAQDYSKYSPEALSRELASIATSRLSVMVPMRDGVKLSTDIYLPKNASGRLPVILWKTPYNEHVLRGEMPAIFSQGRLLKLPALPAFLNTYIDRTSFSFTGFLRGKTDSSSELHQWIRDAYFSFRELELSLLLQGG